MRAINSFVKGIQFKDAVFSCEAHGEQQSTECYLNGKVKKKSSCPICDANKEAQKEANRKHEVEEARKENLVDSLKLLPRLNRYCFENYNELKYPKARKAFNISQRYCSNLQARMNDGSNLVFHGNIGGGKTFFSISILKEAINQGFSAKYQTVPELFRNIKRTFNYTDLDDQKIIDDLIAPDFLVLDEIGVSFNTNLEKVTFFSIINERYNRLKPTIIVSNLDIDGLKNVMGERVIDRLSDGSSGVVEFNWGSLRGVA
jgi:DNA replication protein DnaC